MEILLRNATGCSDQVKQEARRLASELA